MLDRKKVIKGLDICLQRFRCGEDCPYYELECEQLREDALALLKEQDKRIKLLEHQLEAITGNKIWHV